MTGLHGEETTRRRERGHTKKGHTQRGDTRRRDIHREGTHGKEIIGRGDYTERRLHRKETTRKADYMGKVEGTHKKTHTERGHTRRTS